MGPTEIKAEYEIDSYANYISCNNPQYVYKFDMVEPLKYDSTFVVNIDWKNQEEVEK